MWTRAGDADGALLEAVRNELDYSHHAQYDGFEPLFRERLETFIRSGATPPEEAYEYESPPAWLEVTAFGYSEQTVTFRARLGDVEFAASLPLWELDESVDITAIADRVVRNELRRLGAAAASNDTEDE